MCMREMEVVCIVNSCNRLLLLVVVVGGCCVRSGECTMQVAVME